MLLPYQKRILVPILLILLFLVFTSCISIPSSVVTQQSYFAHQKPSHGSYAQKGVFDGLWAPYFTTVFDQIEQLMLIDIKDDPVYKAIELQNFYFAGRPSSVIITEQKDGRIDYYYEDANLVDATRKSSVSTLLNSPYFHQQDLHVDLKITSNGLQAYCDFFDREGRHISLSIIESLDQKQEKALLAPVSTHSEQPTSFPLVFLDSFSMVARRNTSITVSIDGQQRKAAKFPLLVEGKRVYYSRYADDVVVADLLMEGSFQKPYQKVQEGQGLVIDGNAHYTLLWENGFPQVSEVQFTQQERSIKLVFQPALPDIRFLQSGLELTGKFVLSVNSHEGVVGGSYTVDSDGQIAVLRIHPQTSWQPPFMGKKWVSTFLYEGVFTDHEGYLGVESEWNRIP